LQDEDPNADEYPAGQLSQDFELVIDEKVPAGHVVHDSEPTDENWPARQFEHWLAPIKIVCVEENRLFTSVAESTLPYIRKSLMPPFKNA
jgi:hypothetical protein